jgi:amino acid permease
MGSQFEITQVDLDSNPILRHIFIFIFETFFAKVVLLSQKKYLHYSNLCAYFEIALALWTLSFLGKHEIFTEKDQKAQ